MQNIMQIAPNDGHTAQNDAWTLQNVGRNTHNVYQVPMGGARGAPQGTPPTPILEKTLMSRNDF